MTQVSFSQVPRPGCSQASWHSVNVTPPALPPEPPNPPDPPDPQNPAPPSIGLPGPYRPSSFLLPQPSTTRIENRNTAARMAASTRNEDVTREVERDSLLGLFQLVASRAVQHELRGTAHGPAVHGIVRDL